VDDEDKQRQPWKEGPELGNAPAHEWLGLSDDDLLHHIESLATGHTHDDDLLVVVRSHRHFFIRQEAAKRITDSRLLEDLWDDRHVGQILVRKLTRREDADYLRRLVTESRHIDVRNAAHAQLDTLNVESTTDSKPDPPAPD
jgi:hypothetical protein